MRVNSSQTAGSVCVPARCGRLGIGYGGLPRCPGRDRETRTRVTGPTPTRHGTATSPRGLFLGSRFSVPAVPSGFVDRSRLVDQVRLGAAGPVTLVSAPAGTGKTVLVSSWAAGLDPADAIVWVSLETTDLDAATVWAHIIEGLERAGLEVSLSVPKVHGSGGRSISQQLAGQISTGDPLTLVLDCDGSLPA